MNVDDAAVERRQQRLAKNAGAEDEHDVGPRRGHQRNFGGIAAAAAGDRSVDRARLQAQRGVGREVARLRVIARAKWRWMTASSAASCA